MNETRARSLNTPKSENIKVFFRNALGIEDISDTWKWEKISSDQAATTLDKYVALRGDIAHRGAGRQSVTKLQVCEFLGHVKQLVRKTGKRVSKCVKEATGKELW